MAFIVVSVTLTACSSAFHWVRRDSLKPAKQQQRRDLYECKRENAFVANESTGVRVGSGAVGSSSSEMKYSQEYVDDCMTARGWRLFSDRSYNALRDCFKGNDDQCEWFSEQEGIRPPWY